MNKPVRRRGTGEQRGNGVERFGLPTALATVARPIIEPMTTQMTRMIQDRVMEFGGMRSGIFQEQTECVVRAGITSFVDMLAGGPRHVEAVDDLFQRVGYQEALHGKSLEHLRATMLVSTQSAWRTIHRKCRELQIPDGLLGRLGDALFAHMDHIEQQMTIGHLQARMELQQDANQWRGGLVSALLAGDRREIERLAAATGWVLPDEVQVLAVHPAEGQQLPEEVALPETLLVHRSRRVAAVIGSPHEIERHRNRIAGMFGRQPAAVSWAVPPEETSAGLRWATRALEMRDLGLIESSDLIQCADHVALLWVQAEPLMRDMVIERELAPLMSEPLRSRNVLAETLLALLETHASAPALAERLGVHPQTVRYRMRRLRALFGERLDAPEQNLTLLLALRASLPLWRSGRMVEGHHVIEQHPA